MKKFWIIGFICLVLIIVFLFFASAVYSSDNCNGADIDKSGFVDLNDLAIVGAQWTSANSTVICSESNSWCKNADINKDGKVNLNDLALLGSNWGKICSSDKSIVRVKRSISESSLGAEYLDVKLQIDSNIVKFTILENLKENSTIINYTISGDLENVSFNGLEKSWTILNENKTINGQLNYTLYSGAL